MGIQRGTDFAGLVRLVIEYINLIIPVLVTLAIVLLFIGIVRYIKNRGSADIRTNIVWSLVALFVLFSVWGILRILDNTFLDGADDDFIPISESSISDPGSGRGIY